MAQNKCPELNFLLPKRYKSFHKETKQHSTFFVETQFTSLWIEYAFGWIFLAKLKSLKFLQISLVREFFKHYFELKMS